MLNTLEPEEALEKASEAVIGELPEKKKRRRGETLWADRPEHLRKPLSDMSPAEKRDYYLWKAGEYKTEAETPVYEEYDLYLVAQIVLPIIADRMPVKKEVSESEMRSCAKAFTPLANKYASRQFKYKEEIAGLIFVITFCMPRLHFRPERTVLEE